MTHKTEYNKRHKQPTDQSNSKADISKISKILSSIDLSTLAMKNFGCHRSI